MKALGLMKQFFPTKYQDIKCVQPCLYSMGKNGEFIFETKGKAVYAFGLSGRGFKHMPYLGKRVLHLV
jgi:glycine/D-amino acid oxidase-like deaminating enzyme